VIVAMQCILANHPAFYMMSCLVNSIQYTVLTAASYTARCSDDKPGILLPWR